MLIELIHVQTKTVADECREDKYMKKLILVILGLCAGIFLIGGALTLLGVLFSFTFGVVGTLLGWVFKKLFTPVVLILIIIFLAYKLKQKSA